MISVLKTRASALVILVLLTSACQRQQSEMWRASDPTYVPFAVKEIATSADNRFVGLTVDERAGHGDETRASNLTIYLLDLKSGAHRRVGSDGELLPTVDDQFIYYESSRSSKPLALIRCLDTVRTFEIGEHNGGFWNSKTKIAIFETGWPHDAEGFNTLGLVNPATGAISTVHVQQTSELVGVCPATGHFYTEHRFSNDELGIDEYDGTGNFVRSIHSPLAVYSAECRYVLPFASVGLHGPDDWSVYEASTQTKLIDFPWNEDGKSDLHWFRAWNPRHDGLLMMYSTEARTSMDTIDVLDVSTRRVVKSWPHTEGGVPVEWSGNGEATVTVRDQHIVFEPLGATILDGKNK